MSIINYEGEAKRIINLLKSDFILPNGSLCLERLGDDIFQHHIFPDLGDFLPFFLYFGEEDFIDKQIEIYKKTLKNDVLVSEFSSFGISDLAKSYEYSDLLFGLFDYHSYKKDKKSLEVLLDTSNTAIRIFKFNKKIRSFYYSKFGINLPILDTRDGTFVEFYVDMYKFTNDRKYLDISYNIYKNLVNSKFFTANKLLSVFDGSLLVRSLFSLIGIKKHNTVIVCKNNTNSLFGMLSLYSITKDSSVLTTIDQIIEELKERVIVDGGVGVDYSKENGIGIVTLTSSFPLIDFLCDIYFETKNMKYLNLAEKIASFWLSIQGRTGLFPLQSTGKESFFDSETDMCVALTKLHELTGNLVYKESSDKCFDGIIKYHASKDYVLGVNVDTGEVINITQRTKFIALFLKLLILKIKIEQGDKIYNNKALVSLLKDR